ncbi:MAG: hypothetical protein U5L08_07860 [Xanthomonadales bacterium]|nr:hypothetical protein [Xanthomonadales bacterium]
MSFEAVDTQGSSEPLVVFLREQLDHVTKVGQPIVDRRRREHEEALGSFLRVHQIEQTPIARRILVVVAARTAITEVMGLVDNYSVGQFGHLPESLRVIAAPIEVGMAEDGQVAEVGSTDMRKPLADMGFPDALLRPLGRQKHYPLSLVHDETLDHHQPHESLAQTDPIAQEGAAVLARDLQQGPVGLPSGTDRAAGTSGNQTRPIRSPSARAP